MGHVTRTPRHARTLAAPALISGGFPPPLDRPGPGRVRRPRVTRACGGRGYNYGVALLVVIQLGVLRSKISLFFTHISPVAKSDKRTRILSRY